MTDEKQAVSGEASFWRAARSSPNEARTRRVVETISELDVCGRIGTDRLGIIPLRAQRPSGRDYVTLTEAVASGDVDVTEVSEEGRVNELSIANRGKHPVLVLDGEELIGAKQNRIVNLTILVPPGTSLNIPVSCVEAGRWASVSRELAPIGRAYHFYGRQMKLRHVSASLRSRLERRADQIAIWDEIDERLRVMGVHSSTSASSAIYQQRRDDLDALTKNVVAAEGDTGAFFLYGNGIAGLELCDSPETWSRVLPHLLASYGLDAIRSSGSESNLDTSPEQFLARVRRARTKQYPAIGLGSDVRLHGRGVCGAALSWEDRIVHLVVFRRCLKEHSSKSWKHWGQLAGLRFIGRSLNRYSRPLRTKIEEA